MAVSFCSSFAIRNAGSSWNCCEGEAWSGCTLLGSSAAAASTPALDSSDVAGLCSCRSRIASSSSLFRRCISYDSRVSVTVGWIDVWLRPMRTLSSALALSKSCVFCINSSRSFFISFNRVI